MVNDIDQGFDTFTFSLIGTTFYTMHVFKGNLIHVTHVILICIFLL